MGRIKVEPEVNPNQYVVDRTVVQSYRIIDGKRFISRDFDRVLDGGSSYEGLPEIQSDGVVSSRGKITPKFHKESI